MIAPKRWLDDAGEAGDAEQELLRAGLVMDPPEGAAREVWAALLTKLPPPGGPAGAGGKAAVAGKAAAGAAKAGAAVGAGVAKSALIGAGSALVLVAAYTAVAPPRSDAPAGASAVTASSSARLEVGAPRSSSVAPGPTVEASASASAEPAAPRQVGERAAAASATREALERETMLREESRQVGAARAALRRGDAQGALGMLEGIGERFPHGTLGQEREALAIEALAKSGRRGEASTRAAAFIEAHPASPLVERVQPFAGGAP